MFTSRRAGRPSIMIAVGAQRGAASLVNAYLSSLIFEHADLRTLLRLRTTCRANYFHVLDTHRRALTRVVSNFVPCTQELLRIVTECHSVIGGEAALAFVMRDPTYQPETLHIFAADGWFEPLLDLVTLSSFYPSLEYLGVVDVDPPFHRLRGVQHQARFRTLSGRLIYICESSTISPCTPISRSWSTALMNFVTEHTFGCAHPRLLRDRRAMYSDVAVHTFPPSERAILGRLRDAGFSFGVDPTAWPEYRITPPGIPFYRDVIRPCIRDLYICPDQGRFFGDRGSLVATFDPLEVGSEHLCAEGIPPFGHMPVWRMLGSSLCAKGCATRDPILPKGVVSITMLPPHDAAPFRRVTVAESRGCEVSVGPRVRAGQGRPRARTV